MCKYAKLLNRYIDNELTQGKKSLWIHISSPAQPADKK